MVIVGKIQDAIEALERAKEMMFQPDVVLSKVWKEVNFAIETLKQGRKHGAEGETKGKETK